MNAVFQATGPLFELVEIIDLKWLMAHEGHRVHVERLQSDAGYADDILTLAARSSSSALRATAARLIAKMAPPSPAPGV